MSRLEFFSKAAKDSASGEFLVFTMKRRLGRFAVSTGSECSWFSKIQYSDFFYRDARGCWEVYNGSLKPNNYFTYSEEDFERDEAEMLAMDEARLIEQSMAGSRVKADKKWRL